MRSVKNKEGCKARSNKSAASANSNGSVLRKRLGFLTTPFFDISRTYSTMRVPWKKSNPSAPTNIFNFNDTDPALPKETVEMLKKFYAFYHKKHWCYSKLYHEFQRKNLACNVVAGKAIISSAVAGGITLNPAVFAALTGFGLVVKGVASFKKYDKKAEKANFAWIKVQENSGRHAFSSQRRTLSSF